VTPRCLEQPRHRQAVIHNHLLKTSFSSFQSALPQRKTIEDLEAGEKTLMVELVPDAGESEVFKEPLLLD
jgi:hypothetical protein